MTHMQLSDIAGLGPLRGKRVLVRIDANVAMDGRAIRDDAKLRAVVPTIALLRRRGAIVICCSHLGEGKRAETLASVADRCAEILGAPVALIATRIGSRATRQVVDRMRPGQVAMLENLRWYRGEEANSAAFARALAALGDVFVNDAFAVCHRAHASVTRVPSLLPAAAGPLLIAEVAALSRALAHPNPPFVALVGGAKISTKVPMIAQIARRAHAVCIGGALASNFLAARGYGVGASRIERAGVADAQRLLRRFGSVIRLPSDVVVGSLRSRRTTAHVVAMPTEPVALCARGESVLDIGPATVAAFSAVLKSAGTIVWNGPMGMFERAPYHHGSVLLARVIALRSSGRAYGVVGGGETLAVLALTGMTRYIDHVSTGGGAMLAFLGGERLPGLTALARS